MACKTMSGCVVCVVSGRETPAARRKEKQKQKQKPSVAYCANTSVHHGYSVGLPPPLQPLPKATVDAFDMHNDSLTAFDVLYDDGDECNLPGVPNKTRQQLRRSVRAHFECSMDIELLTSSKVQRITSGTNTQRHVDARLFSLV